MNCKQLRLSKESHSIMHPICSKEIPCSKQRFQNSDICPETVRILAVDAASWENLQDKPLTERERDVLQLIVEGNSNVEIAQKLYLTLPTIKTHIRHIFTKLNVQDRTQAAVLALRAGLVN